MRIAVIIALFVLVGGAWGADEDLTTSITYYQRVIPDCERSLKSLKEKQIITDSRADSFDFDKRKSQPKEYRAVLDAQAKLLLDVTSETKKLDGLKERLKECLAEKDKKHNEAKVRLKEAKHESGLKESQEQAATWGKIQTEKESVRKAQEEQRQAKEMIARQEQARFAAEKAAATKALADKIKAHQTDKQKNGVVIDSEDLHCLRINMSWDIESVQAFIGHQGSLDSKHENIETWSWKNKSGSFVTATFKSNRLTGFTQSGIE